MKAIPAVLSAARMVEPGLRWKWGMLALFAAVAAFFEVIGIGAIFGFIGLIADLSRLSVIPWIGNDLVALKETSEKEIIVAIGLGILAFFIIKNLFYYFLTNYQEKVAFESATATASRLFKCYLRAPYYFYFRRSPSDLLQALTTGVDSVIRGCLQSAAVLASEALTVAAIIAILIAGEPTMALVALSILGGFMLATIKLTHARLVQLGTLTRQGEVQVLRDINHGLGAVKDIMVLDRADFFSSQFAAHHQARSKPQRQSAVIQALPRLAMETILAGGMILVIVALTVTHGNIVSALPTLGVFAYAGFRLMPSANKVMLNIGNIHRCAPSVDVINRDFALLNAESASTTSENVKQFEFHDKIQIRSIEYSYPGTDRIALHDVSLTLHQGRSVGIVGTTGAGKSTLVDLILGLLSPQSGEIVVDGKNIASNLSGWRRKIGYVPQSIYLIDDSLRRNIAFGIPDADIDDKRVRKALAMAQLLDFVDGLPAGLDTTVGDRGITLSGGQRQRIGISRALYHQPELLIFDEATSALDAETERALSDAIDALSGSKTIILVAHRLSTLRSCDEIVLLKDGRVAGHGGAAALAVANNDFRRLVELSMMSPLDESRRADTAAS